MWLLFGASELGDQTVPLSFMEQTNKKAILYARVSSREQEETGYSLDAQEKLLKEYAEKHFKIVKLIKYQNQRRENKSEKHFRK